MFLCCSDLRKQPETHRSDPVNTMFLFWYFSKFLKCFVYESSGEQETPSHSVSCLSFFLTFFLSFCQLFCQHAFHPGSLTVSPPVSPSQQRLLIVQLCPLLPCTPPISAGSYRVQHTKMNDFLLSHSSQPQTNATPGYMGSRESTLVLEAIQF